MNKLQYHAIEESYKYATPILIGCFLVAVTVVSLFIYFLPAVKP